MTNNRTSLYLGSSLDFSNQYLGMSIYITSDSDPSDTATYASVIKTVLSIKRFNSEKPPYIAKMSPTETLKFYMLCDYILKITKNKSAEVSRSIIERRGSSIKIKIVSPLDKPEVNCTLFFNFINEEGMYLSMNIPDIKLLKLKLYEALRKLFIGLSDDEFHMILCEE